MPSSRWRVHPTITVSRAAYPKHFVGQALRRSFLCGEDAAISRSFEHRRQWIEDRLYSLSEVFAIDLCRYAVMSNHYHVVLHVDVGLAHGWPADEVIERWHRLFASNLLSQRYCRGASLSRAEQKN